MLMPAAAAISYAMIADIDTILMITAGFSIFFAADWDTAAFSPRQLSLKAGYCQLPPAFRH